MLVSVDKPLGLFPSSFAMLPGFTASTAPAERLATIKECAEWAREGGGLCPLLATGSSVALQVTEESTAFLCCWREGAIPLLPHALCPRTPPTFSPSWYDPCQSGGQLLETWGETERNQGTLWTLLPRTF